VITVSTLAGVVTLSGEVVSTGVKARAERLAKGVSGVKVVITHLVVVRR
jgi:osmotically-inducible protein OsmY